MVNIQIKVKFRIAGITLGTVNRTAVWQPPFWATVPAFDTVLVNERGIYVRVYA